MTVEEFIAMARDLIASRALVNEVPNNRSQSPG
jgi:hypothetical protein